MLIVLAVLLLQLDLAPARPTLTHRCVVTDFGAKPDGHTLATDAIQAAISSCAGNVTNFIGEVVLPAPGTYLTGPLRLRSNLRFVIEPGATLQGVGNRSAYPAAPELPSYCGCRGSCAGPLLQGFEVEDVILTGGGTIDGGFPEGGGGPRMVQFRNARNITIESLTLQHSAYWTVHLYASEGIKVFGNRIQNGITVGSTDGVDIDSSRDVHIANNHIEVGDDGVAVKSGMDSCGRSFNKSSSHIMIEKNFFNFSGGVAFGSEMSGGALTSH